MADLFAEFDEPEVAVAEPPADDVPDPAPPDIEGEGGEEPDWSDLTADGRLFDVEPAWTELWKGMPEFSQKDLGPLHSIYVHFASAEDREAFAKLVGQTVTPDTRSVWYPAAEIGRYADKEYTARKPTNPKYPVYVISKGRADSRLTSKSLEAIGVPYKIVVEPQERDAYAAVIDPEKILVLPFSELGQGSIPVRNWVWDHAVASGAERHWILDDNIGQTFKVGVRGFFRLNNNLKIPVADGSVFSVAENFVDRYENIALSGFNYFMFGSRKTVMPPFVLNTRIYSCILIKNDIPYRWRGRYNEDTDLSIRVLKDGWTTVLFNAFLCWKQTTMTIAGGNTDELYADDGRLKMAESLREQHPDVVQVTEKWGRPQHYVNYKVFRRNKLIPKPGIEIPEGTDDYGMTLKMLG